jgi:hypothetical protein
MISDQPGNLIPYMAKLFLIGGLKVRDISTQFPREVSHSGWGVGIVELLHLLRFRIFTTHTGKMDNRYDGERHEIFTVGLTGNATHTIEVQWNNYSSSLDHMKIICGKHNVWPIKITQL